MTFKALIGALFAAVTLLLSSGLLASGAAQARTFNIVGFGDSLMAGYELPADEAFAARLEKRLREKGHDVTITNAGVSGDTTADGLARLDWSIPDGTDGVILELGANDALRGLSPAETRSNLEAMIERLKARNIPVLLAGIVAPPNMGEQYGKEFNPIYPELATKHGLPLYPIFLDGVWQDDAMKLADGMHPNGQGTSLMAEKFLAVAETFLKGLKP